MADGSFDLLETLLCEDGHLAQSLQLFFHGLVLGPELRGVLTHHLVIDVEVGGARIVTPVHTF